MFSPYTLRDPGFELGLSDLTASALCRWAILLALAQCGDTCGPSTVEAEAGGLLEASLSSVVRPDLKTNQHS